MRAFLLCLLAAAAALAQEAAQAPVSAYVLNSATYDAATASGKWFIKYYGACDYESEQTCFSILLRSAVVRCMQGHGTCLVRVCCN